MKRNIWIILFLVIIVGALAFWFSVKSSRSTLNNHFVVYDTAAVCKIFMADKNNNTILLDRTEERGWRINDSLLPIKENVNLILETLYNIQIKYPVSKSAEATAIKRLATTHVKVEVYAKKALFELFGQAFFTRERLTNVFYVGGPTTDNLGTIMKSEEDNQVYVTYIPGFRGYLSERFSPKIADWRSHLIFSYLVSEIESVRVDFPNQMHESYEIINNHNRTFSLIKIYDNVQVQVFDTMRIMESLAAFNRINYEALLDGMKKTKVDSLLNAKPYRVLTLKTKNGEEHQLLMYQKPNTDHLLDFSGNEFPYDVDRLYGFIDDSRVPVSIQYFVIDNISRPLSYFLERVANKNPE